MGEHVPVNAVAINYPVLAAPKPSKKRPAPKYSGAIVFDFNDPAQVAEYNKLKATIDQLQQLHSATDTVEWKQIPGTNKYQCNWTAMPERQPALRDEYNHPVNPTMIAQTFYSGLICNFYVDVYHQDEHNRICLSVLGIQKVRDGERLDNAPDPDTFFEPVATPEYPPQPPAAPPGYPPQAPTGVPPAAPPGYPPQQPPQPPAMPPGTPPPAPNVPFPGAPPATAPPPATGPQTGAPPATGPQTGGTPPIPPGYPNLS